MLKKFYIRLKVFYAVAAAFLAVLFVLTCVYNIPKGDGQPILLMLLALVGISAIAIGILLYYRNVVVDISFDNVDTIVKTNSHVYRLPSVNFTEINDAKSVAKIYLLYSDEKGSRRFVFQKRYSPFRSYSLNMDEMKKHMTSAIFKVS